MIGRRKAYDPVLGSFGEPAEKAVKTWLSRSGYSIIEHPHGKMGVDCEVENGAERFWVEVERAQQRRWEKGRFPYRDLHVLERRARYDTQAVFLCVCCDLSVAVASFSQSWTRDRLKSIPNKLCPDGTELAFLVPTVELLPVLLSEPVDSFAASNNRKWKQSTATKPLLCKEYLGTEAPYGVNREQWTEWCRNGESQFHPAEQDSCPHPVEHRDVRPDTYGRSNYRSHYCKLCGRFYGHGPADTK